MQYRAVCSWISHNKSRKESPQDVYGKSTDQKRRSWLRSTNNTKAAAPGQRAGFRRSAARNRAPAGSRRQPAPAINRRFEFVMIDEYQDTNRSQYELMRLLTEAHKNICVVGDEDQSIYGWRGADIRNILDFERDFPERGDSPGAELPLDEEHSGSRQRRGRQQHRAQGQVAVDRSRRGRKDRPVRSAFDGEHEALFIADTIDKLLSRQNPGDRVAVLYRTNFQSRQIEEALRRYNRKYVVVGGFSFYQRAEVKDALAYLKS
jgi:DNA helicase II / ATP-dependent DNA helicase PcrA